MKITKSQIRDMIREELLLEIPGRGSKIYKLSRVKIYSNQDEGDETVTIEDRRNEIVISIREVDELAHILKKIRKGWRW